MTAAICIQAGFARPCTSCVPNRKTSSQAIWAQFADIYQASSPTEVVDNSANARG